ncbi:hypothetical protein ACROYT_G013604 [Oculina patagonica]
MKRVEQLNQKESLHKSSGVSSEERKVCLQEKQKKKQKGKRNSCPLSYIEVIAYAILSSPRKRTTLSEIYSFIEDSYPEFIENRVRWKNTVHHNLSIHKCFQRGEIALDKTGCYWRIHPSFVAHFSRGDFSRRKATQIPPFTLDSGYSPDSSQILPFALDGQKKIFDPPNPALNEASNFKNVTVAPA